MWLVRPTSSVNVSNVRPFLAAVGPLGVSHGCLEGYYGLSIYGSPLCVRYVVIEVQAPAREFRGPVLVLERFSLLLAGILSKKQAQDCSCLVVVW